MKDTVYAFAERVDRELKDLTSEEFHSRSGRSKRLREELLPLSRLALFVKLPGLEVEVEAFEDSGRADGFIRIVGFKEREFEVQITFAGYEYADALRAELLVIPGFAPGAGEIRRSKKDGSILATMGAVDQDEHIGRISAAVMKALNKKADKPYAENTVLLVAFEELKIRGRFAWNSLLRTIEGSGKVALGQFSEIYFFNCATNEIQKIT